MADTKLSVDSMEPIDITPIDKDNMSFFEPMLPVEMVTLLKNELAFAMGAVVDNTACGIIVVQPLEVSAQILWIFVAEDYRREYIGSTLFGEITEYLQNPDSFQMSGVFCRYSVKDDDSDSEVKAFLESVDFEQNETGEYSVSLTLAELNEIEFAQNPDASVAYFPVMKLSPFHLYKLNEELDRQEANFSGEQISFDSVMPYCSTVMYRSEKPTGCVCVSDGMDDKDKILTVLFIGEKDTRAINGMFRNAAAALTEKHSPDTILRVPIVSESAGRMAKLMFKNKEKICEKVFIAQHYF
ncbi:MAG: hypothetical protein FWD34_01065 [Oscillospiraceae bacterium]|nr:hypothetical protein [Oscillospiraceae bacterium]